MSDMVIHSQFREYAVDFVEDFSVFLKRESDAGAFVILDKNVSDLYRERLAGAISKERCLIIEANEANKTLEKCKEVIEVLVEKSVRRDQKLIAVGGGVIQDITAFVASILYRGIEWSFYPTTLLAQVDSCIGSKTSINLGDKKNLIGNFYPPSGILIDVAFLNSLADADIKSGIGEMLHFYLYANSPFTEKLLANYSQLIVHRAMFVEYVKESLAIKKSVAEVDEFDKGERNKFNYGHTFGHAIESVTDYAIKHGQAVTVGMDLANYVSEKTGLMSKAIFQDLHAKLSVNFPKFEWGQIDLDRYFALLLKDKKNIGNSVGCILAKSPGILLRQQLPMDDQLKGMIRAYFSGQTLIRA
jgi:3-dehydroquinate synthase